MWRSPAGAIAVMVMVMLAGNPAGAGQASSAKAAVRQAEGDRFAAMSANDVAAVERMLGDDLVYTHSTAQVESKTEFLESMRGGTVKYISLEARDQVVRVYGQTAVITGGVTITSMNRGEHRRSVLRYTDVWVQRDGRWQMVSWQSTRLPETP